VHSCKVFDVELLAREAFVLAGLDNILVSLDDLMRTGRR
jgi:hypothetical protein